MNANVSINHHSSGIAGAKKGEKERKKKKENIFIWFISIYGNLSKCDSCHATHKSKRTMINSSYAVNAAKQAS